MVDLVDRVLARHAGMSLRPRPTPLGSNGSSSFCEAAERVAAGVAIDWPALARELGYHDQAHLIHDFKAQIGFTPAVYAKRCAAAASREG